CARTVSSHHGREKCQLERPFRLESTAAQTKNSKAGEKGGANPALPKFPQKFPSMVRNPGLNRRYKHGQARLWHGAAKLWYKNRSSFRVARIRLFGRRLTRKKTRALRTIGFSRLATGCAILSCRCC